MDAEVCDTSGMELCCKVKWWQPVFVFNPRHDTSWVCRVPRFIAEMIVRGEPSFDWWPNKEGA